MYEIARIVHGLAATVFAGGMVADMLLHQVARARFEPQAARLMFGKFQFADTWITPVLVVALIASGGVLVADSGWELLRAPWLVAALAMFAVSGLMFGAGLMPVQKRIAALVAGWADRPPTPDERAAYDGLDRRWERLATPIAALTLAVLLLMFWRPR